MHIAQLLSSYVYRFPQIPLGIITRIRGVLSACVSDDTSTQLHKIYFSGVFYSDLTFSSMMRKQGTK